MLFNALRRFVLKTYPPCNHVWTQKMRYKCGQKIAEKTYLTDIMKILGIKLVQLNPNMSVYIYNLSLELWTIFCAFKYNGTFDLGTLKKNNIIYKTIVWIKY